MFSEVAHSPNTGIAVKPQSICEPDGVFQGIKDIIKPFGWSADVAYTESDSSDIDIRAMISKSTAHSSREESTLGLSHCCLRFWARTGTIGQICT